MLVQVSRTDVRALHSNALRSTVYSSTSFKFNTEMDLEPQSGHGELLSANALVSGKERNMQVFDQSSCHSTASAAHSYHL